MIPKSYTNPKQELIATVQNSILPPSQAQLAFYRSIHISFFHHSSFIIHHHLFGAQIATTSTTQRQQHNVNNTTLTTRSQQHEANNTADAAISIGTAIKAATLLYNICQQYYLHSNIQFLVICSICISVIQPVPDHQHQSVSSDVSRAHCNCCNNSILNKCLNIQLNKILQQREIVKKSSTQLQYR